MGIYRRKTENRISKVMALSLLLSGLILHACDNGTESATDLGDSITQPAGNDGVPLDNLERTRDTDTVNQQAKPNSGVSLDDLDRSDDADTIGMLTD